MLQKRYLVIILVITIAVVSVAAFYLIRVKNNPKEYNAVLADLELIKNPVLLYLNVPQGNDSTEFPAGFNVLSSDGKVNLKLDSLAIGKMEFISPQKMFVNGRVNQNGKIADKDQSYWVTPSEVKEITSTGNKMEFPSLSPAQKFIRFNTDEDICIAPFSLEEIGECQSLIIKLNNNLDFASDYLIDGDWLENEDVYVLRIMSRSESNTEPASEDNMPPRLTQKEISRYFYYPETGELKAMSINDEITLKTRDIFLTIAEKQLNDSFADAGKYELVNNGKDGSVGILEKETDRLTKLVGAPYEEFDSEFIPRFDLRYYAK